jgi:outer membrane lipoprotein SlyB
MRSAFLALPIAFAALAGCVDTTGGVGPTVTQAQTLRGTIVAVTPVVVGNNSDQVAGGVAGAVVGGLIGNQFGGGTGREVMTAAGAVAGAAAGSALARGANDRVSNQWTIRLADGRTMTVVQDGNFRVGQNVNVVRVRNSWQMTPA